MKKIYIFFILIPLFFLSACSLVREKGVIEEKDFIDTNNGKENSENVRTESDNQESSVNSDDFNNEWLVYKNEAFGFTLKYPKNWNLSEDIYSCEENNTSNNALNIKTPDDKYVLFFYYNKNEGEENPWCGPEVDLRSYKGSKEIIIKRDRITRNTMSDYKIMYSRTGKIDGPLYFSVGSIRAIAGFLPNIIGDVPDDSYSIKENGYDEIADKILGSLESIAQ